MAEPAPVAVWFAQYNGPLSSSDSPTRAITDAQGNTYVTGRSCAGRHEPSGGCSDDYATMKYDSNGNRIWVARFDIGGHDSPTDMSVDAQGYVYVTGISKRAGTNDSDFTTIKYDQNGVQRWVRHYSVGTHDRADSITVDKLGNVIVTGYAGGITTVKYSGAGTLLWAARYAGSGPGTTSTVQGATDAAGNVYVTGDSGGNYLTLKYDSAGNQLWSATYDGGALDGPRAMAVDAEGGVVVTGISYLANFSSGWFTTVKYDTYGSELWVDQSVESQSPPAAMVMDPDGNVYISGLGVTPTIPASQITYKLNSSGARVWSASYGAGQYVSPRSVAVDAGENVFVSGRQYNQATNIYEIITLKYNSNGVQQWILNSGEGSQTGGLVTLDAQGSVYVTKTGTSPATWTDFVTIKYVPAGQPVAHADLEMTLIAYHGDFIAVDGILQYVFTVTNQGPDRATSLVSTLTLPAGTSISSAWSQGNCSITGSSLSCSLDILAAGETTWVIVMASPSVIGNLSARASVTANTPDSNLANNSDSVSTYVIATGSYADIGVNLIDSPDPARPGGTVAYVAVIENLGPDTDMNVTARVFVTGTIVTGTWSSQGTCTESGGSVRCELGALPNGASTVVVVYVLAVGPATIGANVEATGSNDPVPVNNRVFEQTTVLY